MFSVHLYFGNLVYTLALPDVLGSVSSPMPITPTSYEYLSHFISHTEQGPSGWTFGLGQPLVIVFSSGYDLWISIIKQLQLTISIRTPSLAFY